MSCASTLILIAAAENPDASLQIPETRPLRPIATRKCEYGRFYGDFVDPQGDIHPFREVRALLEEDPDSGPYMVTWRRQHDRQVVTVAGAALAGWGVGLPAVLLLANAADAQFQADHAFVTAVLQYNSARRLEAFEAEVAPMLRGDVSSGLLGLAVTLRERRGLGTEGIDTDVTLLAGELDAGRTVGELSAALDRAVVAGHGALPLEQVLAVGRGLVPEERWVP